MNIRLHTLKDIDIRKIEKNCFHGIRKGCRLLAGVEQKRSCYRNQKIFFKYKDKFTIFKCEQ